MRVRKWIRGRPELRARAREFRKPLTANEARLWRQLRGRRLCGLKFRRQHPIQRYIVDFYCAKHRLIVEVDGDIHECTDVALHDRLRGDWLASRGYRILRFTNADVESDVGSVLAQISAFCTVSKPSPKSGRGAANAKRWSG